MHIGQIPCVLFDFGIYGYVNFEGLVIIFASQEEFILS